MSSLKYNSRINHRRGYTLLEILISVSLMLILMYAVAAIFGRVGTIMNDTQSTMGMTNSLRNAKNRLERDLRFVSVPMKPPRNSNRGEGYFCYIEGLGGAFSRVNTAGSPFGLASIVQDTDRSDVDTTPIDSDDILMFTARAPVGEYFRGRLNGNMVESEFAEVIWFVRGTTLYRRVLLIIPHEQLQNALGNNITPANFYQNNDISVHEANGFLVANTLSDLSNRKNRYGYWSSVFGSDQNALHGANGAWYWLRLPTLQESAYNDVQAFNAGFPFGYNNSSVVTGYYQPLSVNLGGTSTLANALPVANPFLDLWRSPNPWDQVNPDSGDLVSASDGSPILNQDVILTNVIGFDVRAWDDTDKEFVSLGDGNFANASSTDFKSKGYYDGFYDVNGDGNEDANDDEDQKRTPYMPCVYDTWTEQYELEYLYNVCTNPGSVDMGEERLNRIPQEGPITSAVLTRFPPPYDIPLKALQVELRVFDPRSGNLRNMTLQVDFSTR
ncbi:MAG: prepilin-type N-terminal cleavage/methylation domain-containing protein [Planctomycetia bacterium]|nr:prepilin-type N-terminal cleavage/methylation domain-containing protein [Planctomycetia bacterium]